jgi:pyridoxine/pyridoxamine 5'-phosphate oxidase
MNRDRVQQFLDDHPLAAMATVGPHGDPEVAVVCVASHGDLGLVIDTLSDSRKFANLRENPRVAFALGWGQDMVTVQYEGVVEFPEGAALEAAKQRYFEVWPDGKAREAWPNTVYLTVRPTWVRWADYGHGAPIIEEQVLDRAR